MNDNLVRLSYDEIMEKIDNKESFILCISRTTCSHCNVYKPKLRKVANKYDIKIIGVATFKEALEELSKL